MTTKPYDPALFLDSDIEIAEYLEDAWDEDDPGVFLIALRDVAKVKGIANIAEATGLGRESLYKTLNGQTKPRWDTVLRVMRALGVRLKVAA